MRSPRRFRRHVFVFCFYWGSYWVDSLFLKHVSSLDPMKIWKRKWTWVFGSSFLVPIGTVFCNMFRPAKSSCSSIWISFVEHKKPHVTQEIEGKYGSAPPLPGQCLRASKSKLKNTLDCSMLHVTSWDAQTLVFKKSWGATANANNKPNGNVFALPCFELFHRCPGHTWGEQLARLVAAPPGFQFPRGPVPTLCEAVMIYKIPTKIQPVWSWYAWWCKNTPNLKNFGEDFSKIQLWKFTYKKPRVFFNEKDLRCLHHSSTSATSPKNVFQAVLPKENPDTGINHVNTPWSRRLAELCCIVWNAWQHTSQCELLVRDTKNPTTQWIFVQFCLLWFLEEVFEGISEFPPFVFNFLHQEFEWMAATVSKKGALAQQASNLPPGVAGLVSVAVGLCCEIRCGNSVKSFGKISLAIFFW